MRPFLYLNITEFIRLMALAALVTHIMPCLASVGMPRPTAGLVAGALPLLSIIGRFGLGWLGDVFDKRHVLATAIALISLGSLAFSYGPLKWAIIPFLLLFPIGLGGSMVVRGSTCGEFEPKSCIQACSGISTEQGL